MSVYVEYFKITSLPQCLNGADFFMRGAVFNIDCYDYNSYYNYYNHNSQKIYKETSNEKRKKEARHNGTDYYY